MYIRSNSGIQIALDISECHKEQYYTCINKHHHEIFIIFISYAIVNPLTMVIHFQNTFITLVTVMSSRRLVHSISVRVGGGEGKGS